MSISSSTRPEPAGWNAQRFEALYGERSDPWAMQGSWYEQRKRALVLASLPRVRYASACEPGCGEGLLTAELAGRCDRLLATDCSAQALATARSRLRGHAPHVRLQQAEVPAPWPPGAFDLVVLSELLYYLHPSQIETLAGHVRSSLRSEGAVLACHWVHPIEGCALTGRQVHRRLGAALGLRRVVALRDADFVLEVWTRSEASSIAAGEGRL
ncbi:class I SAM-dependent DNA methyltransferase [Pulveribacter suum]|uniref:SAM-dependent methyltransferase n=1 Tax=Pulveribacter suum TaxID=2116657 RepID=A0A2P1NP57_9BURK|nr:class I SAM-dependent methyltransferase [Pulveribacter suum]AVP58787.1 SAM-dependent methyltransferase [Pulveribacter suum]